MAIGSRCRSVLACCCLLAGAALLSCRTQPTTSSTSITFTHVPPSDAGGAGEMDTLSGKVEDRQPGTQLVIYAYSRGSWYVQPITLHPFTPIKGDGSWSTLTHLGDEYAAILAKTGYQPANTLRTLPVVGGSVLAVKSTRGVPTAGVPEQILRFSGYDWRVRQLASDRYGTPHLYAPSNVALDAKGYLHLRVTKEGDDWICSEVALPRSLGYGKYSVSLEGIEKLEPATVFGMFTWDKSGTDQDRREMDALLARWGDPAGENGEFQVQPFYRPTNTYRYSVPLAPLTLTMAWESGRVTFSAAAGEAKHAGAKHLRANLAEHTFTADINAPSTESIHLGLCTFDYGKSHQSSATEAVVKSFRYLP